MSALSSFGVALLLFATSYPLAQAQVVVPSTASFALNGGSLDLAATGLQVGGTFSLGSGSVLNAAGISILSGGTLDGGNGLLTLFGNWSNAGTFTAGTSSVNFVDGASAQSSVSGNSTFANASFVSTTGKNYIFAAGSTQSVSSVLTIQGTAAQGIQFKSSAAGQVANIDLLPGGSQNIQYVGVSDVHATGQHLAANEVNDGGTGNATGWFGSESNGGGNTVATPALSTFGLLLLALLMATVAMFTFTPRHPPGKIRS